MVNEHLGTICNAHVVHADCSEYGALDEKCIKLAELAAIAVDFSKTGKIVAMPPQLKPKLYPDFMGTDQAAPMNQATTQAPKAQPLSAAPKFRPKQSVRRPPGPPLQPNEPSHNVQPQPQGQGLQQTSHAVSNETLAAASPGTSSRLFQFIPTPGMKPPPKKQ